ncbi:MAG: Crp/Fnr family transcriptional regulator [Parachlamydiaceae bacterium]
MYTETHFVGVMMLTLEKLMFLHDVAIFRHVSDEILLELAFVSSEEYAASGELIVSKGEFGADMYIVASGKVQIHDGDKIYDEIGAHDVFGEITALSPRARIASATAIENTVLLKINHEVLYDIMARNIGLVKGVIEVLCQRQRTRAITPTDPF